MNSQIYCMPQKFGWNALPNTGPLRPKKDTAKNDKPYFTVQFDGHEISTQVREEFQKRYPKMGAPAPDSEDKAKAYVYLSETAHSFQPHYIYPKITAPITFEKRADNMRNGRRSEPPFETLMPPGAGPHDDPERGFFSWRRLLASPTDAVWQPYERRDWTREAGERSTLPPVRLRRHDPTHEKERWDYIRNLARRNALSYPYRRDLVGYTGHKQWEEHIMSSVDRDLANPNPAMESTTQAVHREFPDDDYQQSPVQTAHKHQGPMSRMVTLTHPYNPYTQQSAYSNVGATGTQ